jgi:tRNA pseudouridine55 synthase
MELLRYDYPHLEFEVRCGKGTYIRALARDLGERLGCGGYIESLRRTRVGPFEESAALALDADRDTARTALLDPSLAAAGMPRLTLAEPELTRFTQGQIFATAGAFAPGETAVFDEAGRFTGIGRLDESGKLHAETVLHVE